MRYSAWMHTVIDNQAVFQRLRQTWQPVAISRELPTGSMKTVILLDEEIIIARLPDGLLAAPDRCPHRGAKFGIGDMHNGHLRCPYHGWEFDSSGSCQKIPSLPQQRTDMLDLACLHSYAIQERYGMIWVRLDKKEAAPLPDIPEYESEDWEFIVADPMPFDVGFRREVDNYLDMSHFAFAHGNSLGVAAQEIIENIQITHYRDGLQMDAPFPALSNPTQEPGKLQQAHHRCQRIYLPNVTTIRQSFHDGDERVLVHIPSPHSETSCTVYWALAISKHFDGPPIDDQISFAINVLSEDKIMVENQRPREVPLGAEEGVTVPADRLTMSYKRAFREFVESNKPLRRMQQAQQGGPHDIAICWGSQTGNSQRLANALQFALDDQGIGSDVFEMQTLYLKDLQSYQQVILISSTYGNGEPPDNARTFYQSLQEAGRSLLDGVQFAVCALGDKRYPHFCQCGRDFDRLLEQAGGKRLLERIDCDVEYHHQFEEWVSTLSKTLQHCSIQMQTV